MDALQQSIDELERIVAGIEARKLAAGVMHEQHFILEKGWSLNQHFSAPRQEWELGIHGPRNLLLLFTFSEAQLRALVAAVEQVQEVRLEDHLSRRETHFEPTRTRHWRVCRAGFVVPVPDDVLLAIKPPPDDAASVTVSEPARLAS